jgi:transposase
MIAVGVDTHKERHYATALDPLGQLLGEFSFGATAAGYAELQRWAEDLGDAGELVFGIEGAGSWGAGLCEHLRQAGHAVLEVERPRRAERPAGKSDRIDALAAAQHVLVGEKVSTLRSRGIPSALRALLNVRRSTIAERTRLLNQLQALNVTAPVALRERIGDGTGKQLERRIMSLRARAGADVEERAVFASCATSPHAPAHWQPTQDATSTSSPNWSARSSTRSSTSPGSDRSQPPSCSPPIPLASSTKRPSLAATEPRPYQPRPVRPFDTASTAAVTAQVDNAIHTIALIRAKHQPETRAYLDRRIKEGKTKREAMRALKRHISRDSFKRLAEAPP